MYACPMINITLMSAALKDRGLEQPALMVSLIFSVGTIVWFSIDFLPQFQMCQPMADERAQIVLEVQ